VLSPSGYFFDVAIIGFLPDGFEPFTRSGARPGDQLVLFGEVGGSRSGLWLLGNLAEEKPGGQLLDLLPPEDTRKSMLEAAASLSVDSSRADIEAMCAARLLPEGSLEVLELAARHIVPLARKPSVNGSKRWAPSVKAMIDISDGLGKDLATLCAESAVGAIVRENDIPVPPFLAGSMEDDRLKLTRFALSSGEEYVALAAMEPGDVPPGAVAIGTVTEDEVLLLEDEDGRMRKLPETGYEHRFGGGSEAGSGDR
jgi:thiamine monophosphate kinase